MKQQIKIEFSLSAKETKRLHGILAIPRVSRNGNLYLPEELARADGMTVPVLWNHQGSPADASQQISQSDIIGTMRLSWDADLMQLKYEAEVDRELPNIPLHTSLGAFFERQDHICGSSACYAVPRGLRFVEASLTPTPGIPETTVNIVENFACSQCRHSSLTERTADPTNMSTEVGITGKQFEQGIKSVVDSINDHFKNIQQAQLEKLSEIIGALRPKMESVPSSMVDDSERAGPAAEDAAARRYDSGAEQDVARAGRPACQARTVDGRARPGGPSRDLLLALGGPTRSHVLQG